MQIPLIALAGHAGSGKDTVADLAVAHFQKRLGDAGAVKMSFAAPLKAMCGEIFGINDKLMYGPSVLRATVIDVVADGEAVRRWCDRLLPHLPAAAERFYHCRSELIGATATVRRILEVVGTEWGRHLQDDVWVVNAIKDAVERIEIAGGPVVFTDARFRNETWGVRRAGGVVVKLVRPGVEATTGHVSEAWIDQAPPSAWSAVLHNDSTPEAAAGALVRLIPHHRVIKPNAFLTRFLDDIDI